MTRIKLDGLTLKLDGLFLTLAAGAGSDTFDLRAPNRERDGRPLRQPLFYRCPVSIDPTQDTPLTPELAIIATLSGEDIVSVYPQSGGYSNPCPGFEVTELSVRPLRDDERGVAVIQSPLGVAFLSGAQVTQIVTALDITLCGM